MKALSAHFVLIMGFMCNRCRAIYYPTFDCIHWRHAEGRLLAEQRRMLDPCAMAASYQLPAIRSPGATGRSCHSHFSKAVVGNRHRCGIHWARISVGPLAAIRSRCAQYQDSKYAPDIGFPR